MPTGLEPKPKEKSPEGVQALFYAIEKNNLVYAQKVLSMNFDPNLHHDNGYTPLAYAAMKGSQPMVELLLRNGADPTQTTKEGDTPVELALRFSHGEVADMLKRARQGTERGRRAVALPAPAPQGRRACARACCIIRTVWIFSSPPPSRKICREALLEKYAKGKEASDRARCAAAWRARSPRSSRRQARPLGAAASCRRRRTASSPPAASTPPPACSCRRR